MGEDLTFINPNLIKRKMMTGEETVTLENLSVRRLETISFV